MQAHDENRGSEQIGPERIGPGRTLGVALGVLALGMVLLALARGASETRLTSAEDALADWIRPGPLPFGLVPDQAVWQGDGFITYTNPDAEDEATRLEEPKAKGKKRGKDKHKEEPYDWSAIEIGPQGAAPIEMLAVRYGKGGAERVEKLFAPPKQEDRGQVEEIKAFSAEGGAATMNRSRMRWHEYEVLFVHQRHLERGGTFRDVIQVNLTLPGRPLVVHVRWPRGHPASLEHLSELLEALRPV